MLERRTKHYVTWLFPGSFVSEKTTVEWDGMVIGEKPKNAYGYYTRKQDEIHDPYSGETFKGEIYNDPSNLGTTYFGEEFNAEQAKMHPEATPTLKWNIDINKWDRIVRTIQGRWFPINADDKVVKL